MRHLILFVMLLGLALPASAKIIAYEFDTPEQEERFNRLSAELRCLVCQNQNIADSNAELALDLRREIYGMIKSGMSDDEIVDFMVARYGDFVLYRPPVRTSTLMLWIGPFIMLVAALFIMVRLARSRTSQGDKESGDLDAAERDRLQSIMEHNKEESQS